MFPVITRERQVRSSLVYNNKNNTKPINLIASQGVSKQCDVLKDRRGGIRIIKLRPDYKRCLLFLFTTTSTPYVSSPTSVLKQPLSSRHYFRDTQSLFLFAPYCLPYGLTALFIWISSAATFPATLDILLIVTCFRYHYMFLLCT